MKIYVIETEWLYPTESGHDIHAKSFSDKTEAIKECHLVCDMERLNFTEATMCDPTVSMWFVEANGDEGCTITCKNELDEWYFNANLIEIELN